eukprot:GHVU01046069.1.p1 GENE.GHVU01046069.1~~GHVU01046069.1.p1  ORF type:complete len:100 (-),score=4.69 GHVU01046069.1:116-415(-)
MTDWVPSLYSGFLLPHVGNECTDEDDRGFCPPHCAYARGCAPSSPSFLHSLGLSRSAATTRMHVPGEARAHGPVGPPAAGGRHINAALHSCRYTLFAYR